MRKIQLWLTLMAAFWTLATSAAADDTPLPLPATFETMHVGTFGDTPVQYRAIAGETFLTGNNGESVASIFSFSYLRTDKEPMPDRPVIFAVDGGPGGSSLWVHLGLFGPTRIIIPQTADPMAVVSPQVQENRSALLDIADIVSIDAVGTGWSRALGTAQNSDYYGVREDARLLSDFVRMWLAENHRENAPVYLAGESYGTTRVVAMLDALSDGRDPRHVAGVILLSPILDYHWFAEAPGRDTLYIAWLPTMAAAGWHHNRVARNNQSFDDFIESARSFALGPYAHALMMGSRLSSTERHRIAGEMAALTGLKAEDILKADLRVYYEDFQNTLLADEGKILDRLDIRLAYDTAPPADFTTTPRFQTFVTQANSYFRDKLGIIMNKPYVPFADVLLQWKGISGATYDGATLNMAPSLAAAQMRNPQFKVFASMGWYDFATPFLSAENTFASAGIDLSRVAMHYYEAGHVTFNDNIAFEKLADDLRVFITK